MKRVSAIALATLLLLAGACGNAAPGDRPNVILIVMDTARADRCSVSGGERRTTPQLEKISFRGLNFRNAWSPAGWTGPAHASMFTGLLPTNHGLRRTNREYLLEDSDTLAELLGARGYRTAAFTANAQIGVESGLDQGFELLVPLFARSAENDGHFAEEAHEQSLKWIQKGTNPFFLFINHMEAHFPQAPPDRWIESFARLPMSREEIGAARGIGHRRYLDHCLDLAPLSPRELAVHSELYDVEIEGLDREIGRFFDLLGDRGLLENTLLIITSDHGENLGEHGQMDHLFSLHRTIRQVPLVVLLPGRKRAGEVHEEVVRLEDIFPTVLEVCGLPVPAQLDGRSLLGDLEGRRALAFLDPPTAFLRAAGAFSARPAGLRRFLARLTADFDGRYHRIEFSDGRELVYDLDEDPMEMRPLTGGIPSTPPAASSPSRK
jgi:arylsulfatase A-like enzyme